MNDKKTKNDASAHNSSAANCYTSDELKKWWIAKCPRCGWEGLSRDCEGGGQIADTGDYDDCYCPECYKQDIWVIVDDD